MKHMLYLKWLVIFCLITVSSISLYQMGFCTFLYESDKSFLGFSILALFYIMTCWCGLKTWRIGRAESPTEEEKNKFDRLEESGWFAADACLTLGMIGTVIGFVMMLGNFDTVDLNNMATVQKFIVNIGYGMSTALLTTLIGLVCSLLLKIQYFNVSQANYKLQNIVKGQQ